MTISGNQHLHVAAASSAPDTVLSSVNAGGHSYYYQYKCPDYTYAALQITKTRLYNFDALIPHFYIVKLGFTGVYIKFLISAQNTDCGYSLEPPRRGGSNECPQSMF